VVKVRRGIVVEIGIVNRQLSGTVREKRRLMVAFWPYV
jgi:hypothetical protein